MTVCTLCEDAYNFFEGLKGKNADETKLLFILHRADERITNPTLFSENYKVALGKTNTGKVLAQLLNYVNLTIDDIYLTNVYKCLLPRKTKSKHFRSDGRKPTKKEYANCKTILDKQIEDFAPKKMVLFGEPAYNVVIGQNDYERDLLVPNLNYKNIPVLLLEHPGKIWWENPQNRELGHYQWLKEFLEE